MSKGDTEPFVPRARTRPLHTRVPQPAAAADSAPPAHPIGRQHDHRAAHPGAPVTVRILVNGRRPPRGRGAGWSLALTLRWEPTCPGRVMLDLVATPAHPALPKGQWEVSKAVLCQGLDQAADEGSLRVRPSAEGTVVLLELPDTERPFVLAVPAWRLRHFLDAADATADSRGAPATTTKG
jgi:hypothetical protein